VIQHQISNIGQPAPDIKHRTPSTKHLSPGMFFKLMKQTQITSTKNPFYALSFGYEETGLKRQTAFWSYSSQKKDRLPEI
jgi:hypothetical protein